MNRTAYLTLLIATFAAAPARGDASQALSIKPITVELRNVTLDNFFRILGGGGGFTTSVDACASAKKLTLKMRNAPLDVVVRAVAEREHLTYRFEGDQLSVGCAEGAPATQAPAPDEMAALRAENARLSAELADARRKLAELSPGRSGQ